MRGNALRYVGWQARDRALPRLAVCLAVIAALGLPVATGARLSGLPFGAEILVRGIHGEMTVLFALIMAAGVIAQDRNRGWFRFYLAKPVSPLWFYGQGAALSLAGMFAASAATQVFFMVSVDTGWSWVLMRDGALAYVLVGATVLFWSSLVRRDWLFALGTLILSSAARGLLPRERGGLGAVLHAILPPFHLLETNAMAGAQAIPREDLLWIGAWGVGLGVVAMVILRRRPLGED